MKIIINIFALCLSLMFAVSCIGSGGECLKADVSEQEELVEEELSLEDRLASCGLLGVIGMTLEEVEEILGPPDEEHWYSGEFFIWHDATELIGVGGNNISPQKELRAGGHHIVMFNLDSFGDIQIGSSFEEVKNYLERETGKNFEVVQEPGPYNLEYKIIFVHGKYVFYFESDSGNSPIKSIQVWDFNQVNPPHKVL